MLNAAILKKVCETGDDTDSKFTENEDNSVYNTDFVSGEKELASKNSKELTIDEKILFHEKERAIEIVISIAMP